MADEETLVEKKRERFEVWSFPLLNDTDSAQEPVEKPEEVETANPAPPPDDETEQLKKDLRETLACLVKTKSALEHLLKQIDANLLADITDIIKNLTQNIIRKTLETDADSLRAMISDTLKQIGPYQSASIFLSESDYERIGTLLANDLEAVIQSEPALAPGDFKIHTDSGQIKAILKDRLNKWFDITT